MSVLLFVLILTLASPLARADDLYDNFECPTTPSPVLNDQFVMEEDAAKGIKWCVARRQAPDRPRSVWGPVCTYAWAESVGFWVEESYYQCPRAMSREVIRGVRTYCSLVTSYEDLSKKPPLHRIIPLCDMNPDKNGLLRLGFGIERQDDPDACPTDLQHQAVVCTPPRPIRPFDDVIRETAADGHLAMTLTTFDYVPLAVAWYKFMTTRLGATNAIVIAMDPEAYYYLSEQGVATALMESISPLNPCCLRRFRMPTWRATNNVKTRALIRALEMGIGVQLMDMDVRLAAPPDYNEYDKYDLIHMGYSFMWSYSRPTEKVIEMWKHVLEEVMNGGWDQDQFKFWGLKAGDSINQVEMWNRGLIARKQNAEFSMQDTFSREVPGNWTHPDFEGMDRFIMWDDTSQCTHHEYFKDPVLSWARRKSCVSALLAAAERLGRVAILRHQHGIDFRNMQRFFPLRILSSIEALNLLPKALKHYSANVVDHHALLPDNHKHHHKVDLSVFQEEHMVFLIGHGQDEADALVPHASDLLQKTMEAFITPEAPGRLQFKCMRGGGPVTETNKNPVCKW